MSHDAAESCGSSRPFIWRRCARRPLPASGLGCSGLGGPSGDDSAIEGGIAAAAGASSGGAELSSGVGAIASRSADSPSPWPFSPLGAASSSRPTVDGRTHGGGSSEGAAGASGASFAGRQRVGSGVALTEGVLPPSGVAAAAA